MKTTRSESRLWFLFYKDQLLLHKECGTFSVPCGIEPPVPVLSQFPVEMADDTLAMAAILPELPVLQDSYEMIGLRASYDMLPEDLYKKAGKVHQLIHWDLHSRYCSVCGTPTIHVDLIMKKCPACNYEIFPSVSPAVLVLIRKGDELLLVHARNFKGSFYGLVAGFLETGETLEQCVRREVYEETSLQIKNITYFGNETWPYPSQLMIGFIADYDSGEIKLQEDELSDGAFFSRDNLPELPRKLSLARRMIDWWISTK